MRSAMWVLRVRGPRSGRGAPGGGGAGARPAPQASDVEEADVLRVLLDEAAARLDVLAHQRGERLVRGGRVLEGHLEQRAGLRVHRGLPELLVVHLAEALVALDPVLLGDPLALRCTVREQRVALTVAVDVLVRRVAPLQ